MILTWYTVTIAVHRISTWTVAHRLVVAGAAQRAPSASITYARVHAAIVETRPIVRTIVIRGTLFRRCNARFR